MPVTVSPSEDALFTALRAFLGGVINAEVELVLGQDNRVPTPKSVDFVTMTPTMLSQLSTSRTDYGDVVFTASIAGTVMSVSAIQAGTIEVGATVFGTGVEDNTEITGTLGGTGGAGNYAVTPTQITPAQTMSSGHLSVTGPFDAVVQLGITGPNSGKNARIVTTMFRSEYAVDTFAAINPAVVPLFSEDPRQIPFIDDENQYENRWIVAVHLQVNEIVVGVPQQFAGSVEVVLINVDAVYPPS